MLMGSVIGCGRAVGRLAGAMGRQPGIVGVGGTGIPFPQEFEFKLKLACRIIDDVAVSSDEVLVDEDDQEGKERGTVRELRVRVGSNEERREGTRDVSWDSRLLAAFMALSMSLGVGGGGPEVVGGWGALSGRVIADEVVVVVVGIVSWGALPGTIPLFQLVLMASKVLLVMDESWL